VDRVRVLFVCSGNAHRSPLAEALLRQLRPDIEVDSAGIDVAIPVSDKIKRYLRKEGAEQFLKKAPESLETKRLGEYDLIVAMQEKHKAYVVSLCPACESRIVVWNVADPYFMSDEDAEKVYELIKDKVVQLAKQL